MTSTDKKTVVLGISGCIAAYKACQIVRDFQKSGVRVKVVMTEHATHFIDPLTFRSLTHEPVAVGLFDDPTDPIHHISLADEADLMVLAPCTANLIAKIAHGIADDLLSTTVLATTAPVLVSPAMNVHMYEAAATQENMATLKKHGYHFIEADDGYLVCGYVGKGRLPEPSDIVDKALSLLEQNGSVEQDLKDKNVLITAGPTVEPIDPVRYITNRSSGKFGYAIASAAVSRGANVSLVSGPVALSEPAGVKVIHVETAREMLEACQALFPTTDIAICAAAVSDMRPAHPAERKLKKGINDEELSTIKLTENPDILATLGTSKEHQVVVGFAAETNDVIDNAKKKLSRKNADMIVANEVGADKTFGKDDDEIWIVRGDEAMHVGPALKTELAHAILDEAAK